MPRKPKPKPKEHRRHGEGTAYQEKSGIWRAAITVKLRDGTTKRIYRRAPTEEAVWAAIAVVRTQLATDVDPQAKAETVRAYLLRWLESTARPSVAASTFATYELHTRKIVAGIGSVPLARLNAGHIQALYAALIKEGMGTGTLRITQAVLHRALKQARRWGLVTVNVAADVELPARPRPDIQPFTPAETVRLLRYLDDHPSRLSAAWTVLATTGLRLGELLGLRWEDVDLDAPRIAVRYQLNREGVLVQLKTPSSRRSVTPLARTVVALRAHRLRQTEEQLAGGWAASPLVFRNAHGAGWNHRSVSRDWAKILKSAGLPHRKPHSLRHGVASYLLSQHVSPRDVAAILGHATPSMTLNVYSHVMPGGGDEAMARLDALFNRTDTG